MTPSSLPFLAEMYVLPWPQDGHAGHFPAYSAGHGPYAFRRDGSKRRPEGRSSHPPASRGRIRGKIEPHRQQQSGLKQVIAGVL